MKILTFYLGEKKYGISIENIVTIEKNNRTLTDIPNTDGIIKGVVNIRSHIWPVIDVKVFIEGEENEHLDETKKMILFELEEKKGALLVDETGNIIDVDDEHIEGFESGTVDAKVINQDEEVFVLLDIRDFDSMLDR